MRWLSDHRFGVWSFAVSTVFIPGIMSAAFLGRWAVIALGVPMMGAISLQITPTARFAVLLGVTWAAVTLCFTPDGRAGSLELFFMIAAVGVMGAASHLPSLDDAMNGMCLGVGVSSLFCLSMLFGHQLVDQGSSAYAGLFYNSEVLTEFAAPLFVWAVVSRRWTMMGCTTLPLLINGSRIGIIAVAVAVMFAARDIGWKRFAALCVVCIGAIIAMALHRYTGTFGSFGQRVVIWVAAAMAITPLGNGLGWYRATHPFEEFAHSDLIQAFAELGIGAMFFAILAGLAIFKGKGSNAERAAFVAVCVEMALSFPIHVPAGIFLAAVLAGYLVRDRSDICVGEHHRRTDDGRDRQRQTPFTRLGAVASRRLNSAVSIRSTAARVSQVGTVGSEAPCQR